jgi:alkylhydroperoxidase family enzyme
MTADDIAELRANGFTDENVFDIVVLTAYRNFMNRVNDGLGVPAGDLQHKFGADHVRAIAET